MTSFLLVLLVTCSNIYSAHAYPQSALCQQSCEEKTKNQCLSDTHCEPDQDCQLACEILAQNQCVTQCAGGR